ncbi:chitin synthase chs-2-like [Haliotis asinina]|uniref:chitin synthase chs-2-like n=1 Tax=Haliotis asinina TaxID=109174 RepID=UPI0035319CC0
MAADGSDEAIPVTVTHQNPAFESDDPDDVPPPRNNPAAIPSTSSVCTAHQAPAGWDTTQIKVDRHQDSSSQDWGLLYTFIRVVVCTLFFCLVLVTATVSKLSLLVMVSNIHVARDVDVVFRNATDHAVSNTELVINVQWIWALLCVTTLPYIFTGLSSLWTVLTMISGELHLPALILALIPEVLHTGGLNLFIFHVLPSFDPITGLVLTVSVGTVPGILNFLQSVGCSCDDGGCQGTCTSKMWCVRIWNTVTFLLHLTVIACLIYRVYEVRKDVLLTCLVPISLFLISIAYWDNFVPKLRLNHKQNTTKNVEHGANGDRNVDTKFSYSGTRVSRSCSLSWVKTEVGKRASKANLCISICKICLTLGLAAVYLNLGNINCWGTFFFVRTQGNRCSFNADVTLLNKPLPLPWIVASVSVVSSAVCYKISKYACKIQAQQLCFALPLTLAFPSTLCILGYASLKTDYVNEGIGATVIQTYFHASDVLTLLTSYTNVYWIPVGAVSVVYLMFGVGFHIWIPKCNRMSPTWRLFQKPLYCGVLLDVSLILNRSREEQWAQPQQQATSAYIPVIHLCATMWQEELREMVQLIKSMLRLDIHQSKFHASKAFGIESKDNYNFDANIFFDNAFRGNKKQRTVNKYVQRLHQAIQQACREVYPAAEIELDRPKKVKTPYGGRLEYTLPNDNKLMVHLKDSSKIRRKKRWSQVMYMYYFLKYGITDNSNYETKEAVEEKAQNTFLLALDGDVDFQPDAVRILLDRMKVNPYIGAVCGRIHPEGSGPMVWYQRFEYAVSHWLQKASENMLGCVLCSPGCFSLFRGSALMDTNVMRAYTKTVSEAAEKIQYDLGEDRWLCTLLLQQGHRVEYSAASDSFTFAPMDFIEFFKQRRRWTPSTMVNILDLIMSWRTTTRNNSDISFLYIIYQLGLFVSSVVTPGTVFMLIVGALSSSFQGITLTTSFLINLAPLVLFVILCFKTSTQIQLMFAQVLTVCYCLLMTVVLVGIIKQAAESGFCSISTIFLTGVAGIFVISALLHLQEFTCLFHGVLYFLLIPSTTLLMVIYSLVNLNDVSWGTRDSGESTNVQKNDEPKKKMATSKKLLSLLLSRVTGGGDGLEAPLLEENQVVEDRPADENSTQRNTNDLPGGELPISMTNDLLDPYRGHSENLSDEEKTFWSNLISEYLKPIDEKDPTLAKNLTSLRNTACLGFILINAVFIILLFALESIAQYTPNLAFELPCPDPSFKPEKVQPLSIAFIVVFGLLLLVQFIAMLFHRFSTLLQIIAGKEINFSYICKRKRADSDVQPEELMRLIHDYETKSSDTTTISTDDEKTEDRRRRYRLKSVKIDLGNRDLWHKMCQIAKEMYINQNRDFSLDEAVRRSFENLSLMSRKTIEILLKKTVDQLLGIGDGKILIPFAETVLAETLKSGIRDEKKTRKKSKTLNSVFGLTVYDKKRRRPALATGGTLGSDEYCRPSRNTTVSDIPTLYSQEIEEGEIKPDYD